MNWERSCGAIVYTRKSGKLQFVIVQEMEGAYSFPKGHMEGDETEEQTARREVFEEIGIRPVFAEGFLAHDAYELAEKPGWSKKVTYFLADCGEETLVPRPGEIRGIQLLPYKEALACFHHEGTRQALAMAYTFLNNEQGEIDDGECPSDPRKKEEKK